MKEKSFLVLCFSFLVIGVFFLCQFRNWGSGSGGFGGLSLFPCGWEQDLGLGMKNSIHVEGESTPTPKSPLYLWA